MTWEELLNQHIKYDGQILTDIDCPKCGRKIYLDDRIVLTTYPAKYYYWCPCGWTGSAYIKWHG